MSEGLEALHHPRIKSAQVDISAEGKHGIGYMFFGDTKQYATIEKDLRAYELAISFIDCVADSFKENDLEELEDKITKTCKALEIIDNGIEFQFLEKKENNQIKYIVRLINFDNPSQCFEWDMEKEKYDLLKEVLLWKLS